MFHNENLLIGCHHQSSIEYWCMSMQALHKNIPTQCDTSVTIDGVQLEEVIESCLFGGDQLTAARARKAK